MIKTELFRGDDMQNKIGKWNITSRLELLLAKIAGHDVDLSTMTPPVATNLTEELLLEIADNMDNLQDKCDGSKPVYIDLFPPNTVRTGLSCSVPAEEILDNIRNDKQFLVTVYGRTYNTAGWLTPPEEVTQFCNQTNWNLLCSVCKGEVYYYDPSYKTFNIVNMYIGIAYNEYSGDTKLIGYGKTIEQFQSTELK